MVLVTKQKENNTKKGLLGSLRGECSRRRNRAIVRSRLAKVNVALLSFSVDVQDSVATKVLAAVMAVVAAAACFRRLRAQLAATTREIGELRGELAQQQAPPAPPAPVAQAK